LNESISKFNIKLKELMRKSLLLIFLFSVFYSNCFSQETIKFRAKYVSYKEFDKYGWSEWNEWKDVNILIVVNTEDDRITIFSSETQTLDVYEYEDYVEGDNTILRFKAIDQEGIYCRIRFVFNEYDDNRQLYVDYSNFTVVYAIKALR